MTPLPLCFCKRCIDKLEYGMESADAWTYIKRDTA